MKVYVVTKGEYSDYSVVSVCSTKKNAKTMIDTGLGDNYIETTLDKYVDKAKLGLKVYFVSMDSNGDVNQHFRLDSIPSSGICSEATKDGKEILGNVWAKDIEHALKIVNEKRIQFLAEGSLKVKQ